MKILTNDVFCDGIGQYSVTARATIIVTAALSVVTSALFLLYNSVMLSLIKRKHEKETKALERNMDGVEGSEGERAVGGGGGGGGVMRTV